MIIDTKSKIVKFFAFGIFYQYHLAGNTENIKINYGKTNSN